MNGVFLAISTLHLGAHRLGIFGAEIEDVADFDAARGKALAIGNGVISSFVVHFRGGGIVGRPFVENALKGCDIVEVGIIGGDGAVEEALVAEDFDLPVSARMMNSWL